MASKEEPEEDRRSRMERLTLRMSAIQTFIAVTSFVVAIIALYAALNEADAARKQLQSSAWPNLEAEFSFRTVPGSERIEFNLRNSGIGPAKVQSVAFTLDGEPLENWAQLVHTFTEQDNPLFSYNWVARRVLQPDDQYALLTVTADEIDSATTIALQDAANAGRILGEICYCSVFEDCWMLETQSRDPKEVKACPAVSSDSAF